MSVPKRHQRRVAKMLAKMPEPIRAVFDSEPHVVSDEEAPECPVCVTGYGIELGTLGHRTHFRCRNCGCEWSTVVDA